VKALPRPRALKMKDLERASGVGRETIRFYIRQGLLPEPERPGRNVAWYDPSFVERLALIKELQRKRFLPLHAIKAIVGGSDTPSRNEIDALLELDGRLFPAIRGRQPSPPETLAQVARRTGLRPQEIRRMAAVEAIELVVRDGEAQLEETATRIVELWAKLREAGFAERLGFPPENLALYVDVVRWLAREELRLFTRGIAGRVRTEQATHMAEAGITLMNQMIGLMRRATLLRYIAEGNVPPPAARPRGLGARRSRRTRERLGRPGGRPPAP
jgi:DNA-binding transcriptional MerR regulator